MVPLRPVVNRALYVSLCRPCVTAHLESVLPSCSQMPSRIHRIIGDFFSPIHGTHRIMKFYTSTWQFVLSKTMGKYMAGAAFLFFFLGGEGIPLKPKRIVSIFDEFLLRFVFLISALEQDSGLLMDGHGYGHFQHGEHPKLLIMEGPL